MAIKNSKYNIHNGSEFETYHFETSQKMVRVLSKNKSDLGSLDEFLFTGKKKTSGSINDLKVPGVYSVTNVEGLPSNVSKNTESLVYVKAVGDLSNPTFINYEIIDDKGNIYNKTVVGGRSTKWTEGGTSLENALASIGTNMGSLSSLGTGDKTSLVAAINELNRQISSLKIGVSGVKEDLSKQNYDDKYLKIDENSALNASINLGQNSGLATMVNGQKKNVITANNNGQDILVGNSLSSLNLMGKSSDLLYNGKKVWTEANHGSGSGLNADKLDGLDSTEFAKLNSANSFSKKQSFVEIETDHIYGKSGNITLKTNSDGFPIRFTANGEIYSNGIYILKKGENDGLGIIRYQDDNQGLALHNFKSKSQVFNVPAADNVAWFNREIGIQGKKLYIQDSEPAGKNHPVGSIWIS